MRHFRVLDNRLMYLAGGILIVAASFMWGCATQPAGQSRMEASVPPTIEEIRVASQENATIVEIVASKPAPHTAFKLTDPLRVVVDVQGVPGQGLPVLQSIQDPNVSEIRHEPGKTQATTTRVVLGLSRAVNYQVEDEGNLIRVILSGPPHEEKTPPIQSLKESAQPQSEEMKTADSESRIFFKPGQGALAQILGVDFVMLDYGKSRLSVTTDRKVQYDVERKGPKALVLNVDGATIPPLLLRHLDSKYFEGALDRVDGAIYPAKNRVSFTLHLRDMVPFHVDQSDKGLFVEFGRTTVTPPEKRLYPVGLVEGKAVSAASTKTVAKEGSAGKKDEGGIPGLTQNKYIGAPMTMDFFNADVTNILRLIGEVSNLNIIWGPEVKGKVSMRLKNVPWDQALDLVLANNNLGMRREGNVIWVTTRAQIAQIEEEERKKQEDLEKRRLEQEKREEELAKREPIETHFITINYAEVSDLEKIIKNTVKSSNGRITIDETTKTIIMTDAVSKIQEARDLVVRLDRPVKQVMIEARIVEASSNFSRELGVQWGLQVQHRSSVGVPFNSAPSITSAGELPAGESLSNPSFSTNTPIQPGNFGLLLSSLSASGLTATFLNTQISLSESEGQLKILSSPKIVTRDNQEASIKQGTSLNLPSGTDSNGNTTFEQVDALLSLTVKPSITPNDRVIMEVKVTDDFPDYANARADSDNVPINKKEAKTIMMVASGDTVVIGGIYRENKGVNELGQPWLRDIPLLGWLFKTNVSNDSRTELLIFLTPTVVPLT
jgi:type IV pilus assembly protein PilQ